MRGDETYPGFPGGPGTGSSAGTSGESLSGSQIDRGSSTRTGTSSPDIDRSMKRSGRRGGSDTTVRPRGTIPTPESSAPSTPSGENEFENPYDLGAAKSPRDGGMMGGADGGTRFESSPLDTGSY